MFYENFFFFENKNIFFGCVEGGDKGGESFSSSGYIDKGIRVILEYTMTFVDGTL